MCNFRHPGTLTLSPERQSARMSKITNDGLARFGTGWIHMGVEGLNPIRHTPCQIQLLTSSVQ